MKVFPIILAGGQGSRFWPVSREKHPKQFLSISSNGDSLIQATARRLKKVAYVQEVSVVTNEQHETLVREHLPDAKIIIEPVARNTAAAIGLAAIEIIKEDPEGVMLVLPADHHIENVSNLINAWTFACNVAQRSSVLVTIGIKPESPHTGYGYIKRGDCFNPSLQAYDVDRFYEKPSLERAIQYCSDSSYSWNSGMFVWKAKTILAEIKDHMPKLSEALMNIQKRKETETDKHQLLGFINKEFHSLESISIDFGVLEHSKICKVVTGNNLGWDDVGSWDVWSNHFSKDLDGNTVQASGLQVATKNCMIKSDKFVATLGINDLIIIDTSDALLICNKTNAQEVKKVVEFLKKNNKLELI